MLRSITTAAIAGLAMLPLQVGSSLADVPPGMETVSSCALSGGEVIPQPAGSTIEACCTAAGCTICSSASLDTDCTFDPAYNLPQNEHRPLGGAEVMAPPSPAGSNPNATVLVAPVQPIAR